MVLRLLKNRAVIFTVLMLLFAGATVYYFYTAPNRYHREMLDEVKLPKGLSPKGIEVCNEMKLAWAEVFDFTYAHKEYRNLSPQQFGKVFESEHSDMLKKSVIELNKKWGLSQEELDKIGDYTMQCMSVYHASSNYYFSEQQ